MLRRTEGGAEGWGSASKSQASKGICSCLQEMAAPELLQARGLICNQFSSTAASKPAGGLEALSIPRLLLAEPRAQQQGSDGDSVGALRGPVPELPPAPGKKPQQPHASWPHSWALTEQGG